MVKAPQAGALPRARVVVQEKKKAKLEPLAAPARASQPMMGPPRPDRGGDPGSRSRVARPQRRQPAAAVRARTATAGRACCGRRGPAQQRAARWRWRRCPGEVWAGAGPAGERGERGRDAEASGRGGGRGGGGDGPERANAGHVDASQPGGRDKGRVGRDGARAGGPAPLAQQRRQQSRGS